ncbi:MAG: TRAP transporter small permease [Oscillospiraceae bacterium]
MGIFLAAVIILFFGITLTAVIIMDKRAAPPKEERGSVPKKEHGGFMKKTVKVIKKITEVFNFIAIAALAAMLLLVCANVVMRYIFKNPIPGTYELTQALMICLTPCIAVNIMAKQCVWVDVFTAKFSRIGQLIVDIITLPISVVIVGIMAWQGFNMILTSYAKGTYSAIMNFRLMEWPFRIVYFIAMAMAALAALAFTIERFTLYKDGGMPKDKTETDRAIEAVGDLSAPMNMEVAGRRVSGCGQIPRPKQIVEENSEEGDSEHE